MRSLIFVVLLFSCNLITNESEIPVNEVQSISYKSFNYMGSGYINMNIGKSKNFRIEYYCKDSLSVKIGALDKAEVTILTDLLRESTLNNDSTIKIIRPRHSHEEYSEFSIRLNNGKIIGDVYLENGEEELKKLLHNISIRRIECN